MFPTFHCFDTWCLTSKLLYPQTFLSSRCSTETWSTSFAFGYHGLTMCWILNTLKFAFAWRVEVCLEYDDILCTWCMNSPKDWTLWGSQLGVEGQSVPVFLTMLLGWSWFWVIRLGKFGLISLDYPEVEADDWISSGYSSSWERAGLPPWENGATIRPVFSWILRVVQLFWKTYLFWL